MHTAVHTISSGTNWNERLDITVCYNFIDLFILDREACMYLISKSKTNSLYRNFEYRWFITCKHVFKWPLKKIFSSLCLCLRCLLYHNFTWDGDPLPFHSHPEKKTYLFMCLIHCNKKRSDRWVKLKRSGVQLNGLFYSFGILWFPIIVTV